MKFNLTEAEYNYILNELVFPLRNMGCSVWCFGSRARGDNQKFSDLDLLVSPKKQEAVYFVSQAKEKLTKSNFPYKVDIVFEEDAAESYLKSIRMEKVRYD